MTKGLEIAVLVRATVASRDDVIDIARGYHLGGVAMVGVTAQGVGGEKHGPLFSPRGAVATLRCSCPIVFVDAHALHVTTRARVATCLDCART
jgi:hypothetical protein